MDYSFVILYCKRDGKDKGMDADKQKYPVWDDQP